MAQPSLLPDELVQELMAVGQVDILVGIPTLNNAATIAAVVKAVHRAFARYFPRDRTVLINSDGGSEDGTRAIVRDLSMDEADTLLMRHSLRTVHRISAPYHGVPGKGSALRQIFAAADLLQARAVVVLDPEVTSVAPEWIQALVTPVRNQGFDFVAPIYARHPLDGPLVSQLVRPLVRAAYGLQIAEPQAAEFGCSGRFAADCLEQAVWETSLAQYGIDLWLTGHAMAGGYRCCQAPLGPRAVAPGTNRPGLAETFGQVVGSLFALLEAQEAAWIPRAGSEPLPALGPAPPPPGESPPIDGERLLQSFGANLRDLRSVLDAILAPDTETALEEASRARPDRLRFPDELWVATVYQFLAAHHEGVMRREHITQALLPLYLARAGSFVLQHAAADAASIEADLEALALQFERAKPYLVQRWTRTTPR
ncbi:MAG: glycosyltransferase [Acidobacteria bacterium]|nr:glycosyltransferase [Acidobacteriota bacterium]